jgi:hypothetical protein
MIANDDVYPTVKISSADTLYHFTTDEGADGMSTSQMMYPSVVAGMQTTHYGRGVYLSDLDPGQLGDNTHGDVMRAIYTRDSAENRRRSNHLASVDVQDQLVLKLSLRNKTPVLMIPTTEPVDVEGRLLIRPTASLVRADVAPVDNASRNARPRRAKPLKPPSAPSHPPGVVDLSLAYRDYQNAKWLRPEDFGHMSFADFLKTYKQDM